jgi:putative ABC transport system ATP-binding protein
MPTTTPLVELREVTKRYGSGPAQVTALNSVTLQVMPGEVVGLLGPSGSGKTTLLNVIGCIAEPSSGWMRLDGDVVYDSRWVMKDLRRLRREKIGFIFQTHNLLPFLDATENVMIALHLNGVKTDEARKRAKALLDYLEVGHRGEAMPGELSGGEAQRVAIARALANNPRVILADEPTAALDSDRAAIVMGLLRKVAREQQAAVLVVSHDDKIFGLFDRVFRLRDGKLTEEQVMLAGR